MNANGSDQRPLIPGGNHPVWSPDGRMIAYNGSGPGDCPPGASRCGHTVAVRIVRADGSADRVVSPSSRNASWSPSGRRVAFDAAIDPYGNSHAIHVANADGTNVRRIAGGGAVTPAWSPDGRLIAYTVNLAIYVVRPDGTKRRRLARGLSPLWASNGARVAYLCGPGGRRERFALCVVDAVGRGRRVVARGVLGAAWSPRGLRLAYARPNGVFVVNADGSGRRRLARKEAGVSIRSLAWSADSRRLVLAQGREYNDLEIHTAHADGTNVKPLTNNAVHDLQPSWAPDGRQLAFVRMRGSFADIWLMDASGRGQRLVVRDGFNPSWTRDASRIVFSRWIRGGTRLYSTYSVSVSGADEQLLVSDGAFGALSPDGAKLAFLRSSPSPTPFPAPEQLFIAAADGSGANPLTTAAATDSLSWSPDSGTLVFSGSPSGGTTPSGLYVIRVDGSGFKHLVSNAGSPSFSPDGAALTFATQGPLGTQVEVSAVDGSTRRVILAARGRNVDPDWQPLPG